MNRGRVLGGSSALNFLCYDRAAAAEYDAWGELGSEGWDWDVMSQGMVKSENFTGTDENLHGYDGPIRSTYNRFVPEYLNTWMPTLNEHDIPTNARSLSGDPNGVMFQTTNIDGTAYTRSYAATAYAPLAGSNLDIWLDTVVAKIDFRHGHGYGKLRAAGVSLADGTKVKARKEVILSAGSIGSPNLLELSGVGQAEVLEAAGIEQVLDLPGVGENYQDHIRTSNAYFVKEGYETGDALIYDPQGEFAAEQTKLWREGKPGWLDYTTAAYSFLNLDQLVGAERAAQLVELAQAAHGDDATVVDKKKVELLGDASVPQIELIFEANYVGVAPHPKKNLVTVFSTLMHPLSRGNVHIDPEDPTSMPIINPNYLSTEYDVKTAVEGAKFARAVANTEPLASLWESEYQPGPEVKTDEEWEEFVRNGVLSFYHPVGTCAMLPKEDGGVVDSDLFVYGTENLRIVDCSVMPTLLSAHIQTAAYGLAEVMADRIISEYDD